MNRADFITRVREAVAAGSAHPPAAIPPAEHPPVGEDAWATFCARARELQTEILEGPVATLLAAVAQREHWKSVMADERLDLPAGLARPATGAAAELARCDAAVTRCEALIAQTGSVLISARSAGGRIPAALAPHHVVLATRDQLVGTLAEAYRRLQEAGSLPSMACVISGPSRTGDIERTIVLGAHGPERLTIIVS